MTEPVVKNGHRKKRERVGKPRCIYLSDHQWETAQRVGGGNASKGIGIALADARLKEGFVLPPKMT